MAETVLFYFTGTGNSLAVARKLADVLPEAAVVPMLKADAVQCIKADTERIGLVYPIHMNAVPRIVVSFLKGLDFRPEQYIFALATHGGIPGKAGMHLDKVLQEQRISLDAYYEVEIINNTPKGVAPKPLMKLDWEKSITAEIVGEKLKAANSAVDGIVPSILGKEENMSFYRVAKGKGISYWMMKQLWKMNESSKPRLDFLLDESCTGCGLCERVCTTNRIKLRAGKPQWTKDDCNYCYACFNYCPVQAIGVRHYTKKLGRYHHPEISAADMTEQTKYLNREEQV